MQCHIPYENDKVNPETYRKKVLNSISLIKENI